MSVLCLILLGSSDVSFSFFLFYSISLSSNTYISSAGKSKPRTELSVMAKVLLGVYYQTEYHPHPLVFFFSIVEYLPNIEQLTANIPATTSYLTPRNDIQLDVYLFSSCIILFVLK